MDPLPMNPLAPEHLPSFVSGPGQSDWLLTAMGVFLVVAVISVGLVYLKLHALPEHIAHRSSKVQYQFVAVLGLLALFTHNNVFWIAALLLALVELPNFSTPMNSIALSLEKLSGRDKLASADDPWDDVLSAPPEASPRPTPPTPSAATPSAIPPATPPATSSAAPPATPPATRPDQEA